MTPQPHEMLAVLGLGLDRDPRASQPASVEPFLQLIGQRLGHERGVVDTLGGRIELGRDREVGRDRALVEQPSVASVRKPMGQGPERSRTAPRHRTPAAPRASRACGRRPRQQVDEVVEAELGLDHREHSRRQRGEELGGATLRYHSSLNVYRAASGELGSERAVGHPDD